MSLPDTLTDTEREALTMPPDEFDIDWDEVPVNLYGETDEETEDEYADED